jgi:CrcB protein
MSAVEAIFVLSQRFPLEGLTDVKRKLLLVLAGGFCGAVTRYLLSQSLLSLAAALPGAHAAFPYDTLLINLSGSFMIGLLFGAFELGVPISPDARLVLTTGFLGAYTTFNSFMVGAATLLQRGQSPVALLYLVGAMAGGVALSLAGCALAGALVERRRAQRLSASVQLLVDGGWEALPAPPSVPGRALQAGDEQLANVNGRAR